VIIAASTVPTRRFSLVDPKHVCGPSGWTSRCLAFALLLSGWLGLSLPVGSANADETHRHGDNATTHHRFESAEEWAQRWEDPERDAWQHPDSVVALLATRDDLVVADIGSGTGYFAVRFSRALPRGIVYGADIEPDMIFYLNDRAHREGLTNLVSVLAEPADPHLPRSVDLVFICNTYHHIDGRIDYFRRLKNQLRADARVAVVDYRPESDRGPRHKLMPQVIEGEMAEAGYSLADRHEFLPEQYFLIFDAGPRQ
jgi:SAM-dependent methyltransferase